MNKLGVKLSMTLGASFYVLMVLSWFGVVSDLRLPRPETKFAYRSYTDEQRRQLAVESRFGALLPKPPTPTPVEMPSLGLGMPHAQR